MPKTLEQIQRSLANKASAYWAKRRTDLRLLEMAKSEHVPGKSHRAETLLGELEYILESTNLIYPPSLNLYGIKSEMKLAERKVALDIPAYRPNHSKNEIEFIEKLQDMAALGRQSEWKWRIANHAEEYQEKGWYPFFITLTVDPQMHDPEEVWREGRALRRYIRRLCNVVTSELELPKVHKTPGMQESDYITYVGVIEHGKSREHHHGHFLIWMKEIPDSWKSDPNKGLSPSERINRENKHLRYYWGEPHPDNPKIMIPYSDARLSPALYFRSVGDVWSKLGHVTPVDKNGKPVRIGTARQSGSYVTKYLAKDFKEWKHRVKATRNLGKKRLINRIRYLTDSQVEALTWRATNHNTSHSLTMIHSVPLVLTRRLARQEHFYRKYRENSWDITSLTRQVSGVFSKMLASCRAGTRPERMQSEEFYDWLSRLLPAQSGYCEKRLIEAHRLLAKDFPREDYFVQHVSIPGNEIGYS